eukprot:6477327-Amphidinium_carterae.1
MSQDSEPQPSCAADARSSSLEPCLVDSLLARQLVVRALARAYVVWRLPGTLRGELHWSGFHLGEHCWDGLQQLLHQKCYQSGRDRLRRVAIPFGEPIVAAGRALFRAESAEHGVPSSKFHIWVWPSPSVPSPIGSQERSLSSTLSTYQVSNAPFGNFRGSESSAP